MLSLDCENAEKLIIGFIRSFADKTGLNKVVLGLSGGLDSSIVAILASQALGVENVFGLILPYKSSSPDSKKHALLVAQKFGIKTEEIDISPMANAYPVETSKVRFGNLLARIRMAIIFDKSAEHGALVAGTSNKTEFLIGYSTWYGDSAAGYYPIADLYKTQIRQLAKYVGVPDEIISKPPSADLWEGQTDEGEIGTTYEKLDGILYNLVDRRMSPSEVVALGYSEAEVMSIIKRMKRTQFKRVMPPVCKLSARTIGYDFNYIQEW